MCGHRKHDASIWVPKSTPLSCEPWEQGVYWGGSESAGRFPLWAIGLHPSTARGSGPNACQGLGGPYSRGFRVWSRSLLCAVRGGHDARALAAAVNGAAEQRGHQAQGQDPGCCHCLPRVATARCPAASRPATACLLPSPSHGCLSAFTPSCRKGQSVPRYPALGVSAPLAPGQCSLLLHPPAHSASQLVCCPHPGMACPHPWRELSTVRPPFSPGVGAGSWGEFSGPLEDSSV